MNLPNIHIYKGVRVCTCGDVKHASRESFVCITMCAHVYVGGTIFSHIYNNGVMGVTHI